MSRNQKIEVPPQLALMAQELAVALVAKHVGFDVDEFDVEWHFDSHKSRALSFVSGIRFLTSDSSEQRRAYIEKRIAVLCARAYATMLVLLRNAKADGSPISGDEFWTSLHDIGDRSLVLELCAAYLIEDANKSYSGGQEEEEFVGRQNEYIRCHGIRTVAAVLTETEFLSFVDKLLSNSELSTGMFRTTISAEVLQGYTPGISTVQIGEGDCPAVMLSHPSPDLTLTRRARSEEDAGLSRRCLVAHEIGHWLAAQYVEIPTSGVTFNLKELSGSCCVFLGPCAFQWSLERYLSARIAVLCAGSYADCWLGYPDERVAIGDVFFRTLYSGTGRDDFAKLRELLPLYRTTQHSLDMHHDLKYPQRRDEILSVLNALLKKFELYGALRSPKFAELVEVMLCRAQSSSNAQVEFHTAELDAACSEHRLCGGDQ
jgi:hypothetical protein